jgi:hypothetical protein
LILQKHNEGVEKVGFDYSQHRLSLNFNCPELCLEPRCFAKFFTPSFDFPVFGLYLAGEVCFDGLVGDDFEVWAG